MLDDTTPKKNQYGDTETVGSFKSSCTKKTRKENNKDNYKLRDMDIDPPKSVSTTASTLPPSTITNSTTQTLEAMLRDNPSLVEKFLSNNPNLFTGLRNASPQEGVGRSE